MTRTNREMEISRHTKSFISKLIGRCMYKQGWHLQRLKSLCGNKLARHGICVSEHWCYVGDPVSFVVLDVARCLPFAAECNRGVWNMMLLAIVLVHAALQIGKMMNPYGLEVVRSKSKLRCLSIDVFQKKELPTIYEANI
ncbi:hypothetical protein V6Z11_A11G317700 [Gossypium hirsutum]